MHAKIKIFFNFLKIFRRRFPSFLHFQGNSVVNCFIDVFILDLFVESFLFSLIGKVCLHLKSLRFAVDLVEVRDCWIFFGLFATAGFMERGDLFIVD
jgi:hypothetical protein